MNREDLRDILLCQIGIALIALLKITPSEDMAPITNPMNAAIDEMIAHIKKKVESPE